MTAVRAAMVSVLAGAAVLGLKLVAWRVTGSVALYSDALESIVNVVAAVVALTALKVAARPADANHPWGHSKAEYFSAGAEGGLIVVAAIAIVTAAAGRLMNPLPIASFGVGMVVSLGASAINGGLGFWLRHVGGKVGSPALVADGTHVLTDVLTTGGVLLGVAAARATGWWVLDPLLAIAVALQIVVAGWRIVRSSIAGLMDEAVDPEVQAVLAGAVQQAMGPALQFHDLRARRAGARTFVELHLVVPGTMTVAESHALCDAIENAIVEAHARTEVTVHVEPETERQP